MPFLPEQSNKTESKKNGDGSAPSSDSKSDSVKQGAIDDPLKTFEIDFKRFDRDKNGFLSLSELEIVETDKSNDADMRRVAGLLKRDIESVEEYSNDEWFDENDGITVKDLHKLRQSDHSVEQPGVLNWIRSVLPSFDNAQGIGIVSIPDPLSFGEGSVPTRILHVNRGSSAEYAGVESGDLIKKVNGQDITSMKHDDVLKLIEGPKGSDVFIEVDRKGKTRTFSLQRKRQISSDSLKTEFDIGRFGPSKAEPGGSIGQCLPNGEYAKIIKEAAYQHYDPFSMGDFSDLIHRYDCTIKSKEDAHKQAQIELSRLTGDSYTTIEDARAVEEEEADNEVKKTEERVDVEEKDLGGGISYIRLVDFKDKHDADKMEAAIEKHKDADALVIDLRGNPGGLVEEALDISSMLIREGKIVNTLHRENSDPANPQYVSKEISLSNRHLVTKTTSMDGDTRVKREARHPYLLDGKPVVVLVNGSSASASELLTGALKYNHAATLVGSSTYGKGIGQETVRINDQHSLKMTTFRFTSPDGTWPGDARYKKYGIKPDVSVYTGSWVQKGSEQDQQLKTAVSILNKELGRTN